MFLFFPFLQTPGPGTYSIPDVSIYKNKLPAITISSRNILPGDNLIKPGPAAYYPQLVRISNFRKMMKTLFIF